jgi:AraC-like DNA-binding protein
MGIIREVKTIEGRRGPLREHSHDEHSIALVWRGATKASVDGQRRTVQAGQAALIAAGMPHECSPISAEDWGYTLLLVAAGGDELLDNALAGAEGGLLVIGIPTRRALAMAEAAEHGSEAAALGAMDELLAMTGQARETHGFSRGIIMRQAGIEAAEARLRSSIEEGASLDELSELAGMGKYGFARAFKAGYGLSPHAYLLNLRVNQAKAMLGSGRPLADTALACGFCDQSHFTRVFERTVGLSPAVYARLMARRRGRKNVQDD